MIKKKVQVPSYDNQDKTYKKDNDKVYFVKINK